jgi:iron complex outermembrane receptor protein
MNPMRCLLPILLLCGPAVLAGPAEEAVPPVLRETIVVTATMTPEPLLLVNRELVVIDGDDLARMPVRTVADIFSFIAPADFQPRVAGGLFGNIQLRGAGYAGVLVCIDGVRWNDPQTAHFNLELPVPPELIERVEILTGAHSVFLGSDAVGGVINIITRRDMPRQVRAHLKGGSFATGGGSVMGVADMGRLQARVFAGTDRSDGFTTGRDFRIRQLFSALDIPHAWGSTSLTYTHLQNRFGADGFYGPYPSLEETRAHGFIAENDLHRGIFARMPTRASLSFRQHDDDFTLYRDNPAAYRNQHRTRSFLFKTTSLAWQSSRTSVAVGTEAAHNRIRSERLGHHQFNRLALAAEIRHDLSAALALQGSLRLDHYSTWGGQWTPGLGLSWFITPGLKFRAAYGKAFRAPSFTELYYESPANVGDPGLMPELAHSVEAGGDWYAARGVTLSLTVWRRWDRNMIDWIRRAPDEPWQAANVGAVDARGLSAMLSFRPAAWMRCQAGYSWNHLAADEMDFESKYAFDYARHHVTLLADLDLGYRTALHLALRRKQRVAPGERYTPVSARLAHRWRDLEFYLQADNLLDQEYEEMKGIPMPGRSFLAGIRLLHLFE